MDSSTRISDLPDMGNGGGMAFPFANQKEMGGGGGGGLPPSHAQDAPPSYMPINVHPNPYGNQPPTSVMPPPLQTQMPPKLNGNSMAFMGDMASIPGHPSQQHPQHSHQQQMMGIPAYTQSQMAHLSQSTPQTPQFALPSRDIPQDMSVLTIDERVQPNYIPPPSKTDYIKAELEEEQEREEERMRLRKKKEKRVRFVDDVFVEIQKPVIITLLFLFFQLPFLNTILLKYVFFLKLFGEDGNINIWGILLKSLVFGCLVYGLDAFLALMG